MPRVLALTVVGACALLVACGPSRTAGRGPAAAATDARSLLEQVPADTPFALLLGHDLIDASVRLKTSAVMLSALRSGVDAAALEAAGPTDEDRFGQELMRELRPFGEATLRRVGWIPGESEVVLYGLGAVPIVRVRADGKIAREALGRIANRADYEVQERLWKGRAYAVLHDPKLSLVLVFHPREVVMALTNRPEAVLDHMMSTAPASPSLSARWRQHHQDPATGDRAHLAMWLDPARLAARVREGSDLQQLTLEATPACLTAVATWLDSMPTFSIAYDLSADGRVLEVGYVMPLPREWRTPFSDGGVAHWVPRPGPGLQFAFHGRLGALAQLLVTIGGDVARMTGACDGDADNPLQALDDIGPLASVQGGTLLAEVVDRELEVSAIVEVDDVETAWQWLLQSAPIGAMPAPGEVRTLPVSTEHRIALSVTGNTFEVSLGPNRSTGLERLKRSPGRPEPLVVHFDGEVLAARERGELSFLGNPMNRGDDSMVDDAPWDVMLVGSTLVARFRYELTMPTNLFEYGRR